MSGNKQTAADPVVDENLEHMPGIKALWKCCGFEGAAGAGTSWEYTPTSITVGTGGSIASVGLYISGMAWYIKDVIGSQIVWTFTPGEIATCQCTLTGIIDSFDYDHNLSAVGAPDFEEQSSISSPVVESVDFTIPTSPDTPKSFQDLTITLDNVMDEFPDSNAEGGTRQRATGRTVTWAGTWMADDATATNTGWEYDEMVSSTAPDAGGNDAVSFTVGTATAASGSATAYSVESNWPEVRSVEPTMYGISQAYIVEMVATGSSGDDELSVYNL
jgi:hypothetical protein